MESTPAPRAARRLARLGGVSTSAAVAPDAATVRPGAGVDAVPAAAGAAVRAMVGAAVVVGAAVGAGVAGADVAGVAGGAGVPAEEAVAAAPAVAVDLAVVAAGAVVVAGAAGADAAGVVNEGSSACVGIDAAVRVIDRRRAATASGCTDRVALSRCSGGITRTAGVALGMRSRGLTA
jgi:hypothetical protein